MHQSANWLEEKEGNQKQEAAHQPGNGNTNLVTWTVFLGIYLKNSVSSIKTHFSFPTFFSQFHSYEYQFPVKI